MNKYRLWLLVIILLALALRFYNLTYHSLWFDEAISVYWARQTVPRILEVGFTLVEDRLPPLYYLLLKGWTTLVGFSETGVRSLSALLGTLLVPVIAAIAASLFNRRIALTAALLIAFNPFLIWYSQETRMYAPAVLFSALTVWAFLKVGEWRIACHHGQPQVANGKSGHTTHKSPFPNPISHIPYPTSHPTFYIPFTLFALAGLYTHLYTGFLLPALGLWLVISYPRQWRAWLPFALSILIITLAFAPLALATWRFSAEASPGDPMAGLSQRAWGLLHAFTVWKAPLSPPWQITFPLITALFALTAYLKPKNPSPSPPIPHPTPLIPHPLLLVTLLLISPFAIANLLLLRNHLAFFGERYFIIIVPWLLLLAAVGAERMGEWANGRIGEWRIIYSPFILHPLSFILFLFTLLPLPGQWSLPAAKEAWRQSVAYLAEHAAPNHGILIHPDWVRYPFQYYFQGPGQTYAAFSTVTPETSLDGPLQGVVKGHAVIWLIQSHLDEPDPHHLVEQWFAARYPLVTELYPPGISLKGYAPGYQLDTLPPQATPATIHFTNGLSLSGYQADEIVSAADELFHPPSGWAHVTLYWTAARPISEDAAPFVHLVGPAGVWGASLERATDALKLYPTSRWPVGQKVIRHDLDINLNPLTPPGIYQLVVGLTGAEQEQFPLAQIEVR
jgi:4-amino-4-deoxy-L-arabinose transferase-like glycosyltransferase